MKKTILITGATSGIGLEFARQSARQGKTLVLVGRSAGKLEEVRKELAAQTTVHIVKADLGHADSAETVLAATQALGLQVDELINNAGFGDHAPFVESDLAKINEMMQVNIVVLTRLTHHYLPGMVARKYGRIMNVASTAAFLPGPLMTVYYATKAFVLSFSEGLAEELSGSGVTVTALCPGPTQSNFQALAAMDGVKLVENPKSLPTSASVAAYGLKHMERGTRVAVPGLMNVLTALTPRFMPRAWVTKVVMTMQSKSTN